ncbi:MAG: LicD family protein [Actinomycetaceae bacterium]|nr:LicD family protein [Actinomycetaceae bacterium]
MNQLLSLKELQHVYIELLEDFDELCRVNNLRYDLCGGSMLGAVRHEGFIPWDDDADVSMPRPDYDRLIELSTTGQLKLPEGRELICNQAGTFARPYARLVRHDVKRVSEYLDDNDCPYIGLDIFTVDGLPQSNIALSLQVKTLKVLRSLLLISLSKPGTSSRSGIVAKAKDILRPALRTISPSRLASAAERICRLVPYTQATYVGIANGMYGTKERWLKKDMLPQKQWKFAHLSLPGYVNADIYLANLYGSYMDVPPASARQPHGDEARWVEKDS